MESDFNPRAPYGARPLVHSSFSEPSFYFNPRAPYGARQLSFAEVCKQANFNPRAPYGARLIARCNVRCQAGNFNPRAPYGARRGIFGCEIYCHLFQSTRPVWGATIAQPTQPQSVVISIHAPRMGRDVQLQKHRVFFQCTFQSTRPVWGATAKLHNFPVQFCARVTVNSMQQTIFGQSMPAASFKLQEHTRISGAKPPEKVCQLALRIQTISTPSGS